MIVNRVLNAKGGDALTVHGEEKVVDVARLFEQKRKGLAVVCNDDEHVIGVVSLGDIVHAIGFNEAAALDLPVRMIMTSDVATCRPDEEIESALRTMHERGIRHLPVVEDGKVKGLIEERGALEVLYEEASLDFSLLRNYVFRTGGRY